MSSPIPADRSLPTQKVAGAARPGQDSATPGASPRLPELGGLATETADASLHDLDLRTTQQLVLAMNDADATVPGAVRRAEPAITRAVDAIAARLRTGGRLLYVGAGTSGRLGVLDASECPPTFGVPSSLVVGIIAGGDRALRDSVEAAEDSALQGAEALKTVDVGPGDAVVGIAASGRTPYVVGALQHARQAGALAVALACNPGSEIGRIADIAIEVAVGPEFIAGSTRLKSGTAEKLVLNMLSTLTMVRLGKTYGNIMVGLRATNDKLRSRARRMLIELTGCPGPAADDALRATGGSVRGAALMLLRGVSAEDAGTILSAHAGSLRAALAASAPQAADSAASQSPQR